MTSWFRRAGANILRTLASVADPSSASGEVQVYAKDASGVIQLFARVSDGTIYQLTPPMVNDEWVYKVTTADFTTNSGTAVAIVPGSGPDLTFAPDANATYAVWGQVICSSLTASVAPQPAILWPGGLTGFGGGIVLMTNAVTASNFGGNTQGTTVQTNTASVPTNLDGYLAQLDATFNTGASPTGTFSAAVETETAGTDVAIRAGSWIAYRRMR